ncbi:hypothetical protein CRYUN_Cryun17cG0042500 [Craigia yunnanensis]
MEIDKEINEDNSRRIQVRFVTKLKAPYKVATTAIAIHSDLSRLGLSSIVNKLLQAVDSEWKTEPFDFLINGELVRMSLEQFLLVKGISVEKILEIEYVRAVAPRKEEEPSPHDDWVSAVDGSSPRVWKGAGWCTHILEGHNGAISSVSIINSEGAGSATVATASKDRTRGCGRVIASFLDIGCSGSRDCTIKLWPTNDSDTDGDVVSIKKRKVNNKAEESQSEREAVSTLVGHTLLNDTILLHAWFCGEVLNCIDIGGEGSALIAAGGSDPILRIWDPRKPAMYYMPNNMQPFVSLDTVFTNAFRVAVASGYHEYAQGKGVVLSGGRVIVWLVVGWKHSSVFLQTSLSS